jgi:hypothetical protein
MAQWKTDVEVTQCRLSYARYGTAQGAVMLQDLATGLMDDKWSTADSRHSHEDEVLALLVQARRHPHAHARARHAVRAYACAWDTAYICSSIAVAGAGLVHNRAWAELPSESRGVVRP